jgi:hypothetical protein
MPGNYPEESINKVKNVYSYTSAHPYACRAHKRTTLSTISFKIQMPENYPEESIQHSEHSESLKSRILKLSTEWKWSVSYYGCFTSG